MIKCDLTGRNFEIDDKLRDYVEDKLGGLEKYLPRHVRETAACNVIVIDDPNGREDNRFVCEAIMLVDGDQLVSREGTVNIYAAVDIVEAKMKAQLAKYKEKHMLEPRRHRMLGRLTGRMSETAPETKVDTVEASAGDGAAEHKALD
jgi:ribosomal subunit interface protein